VRCVERQREKYHDNNYDKNDVALLYCFVCVINQPLEIFGKKTNKRVINCYY